MQEEGNHILILFATSALFILLIVILAIVFLTLYQKKIVSQRLHIQEAENEFQQKLLRASIESQEKERKRIASDLHDEIGALLSGLKTNISYLKSIERIGADEKEFLSRTDELIDDGLTNVRRISYDLLPPTLVRFGLWEAISELVRDLSYNQHISIEVDVKSVSHLELTEASQLAIFRVLKELTANSLRQKAVSEIRMDARFENEIVLSYSDNGHGFTEQSEFQGLGIFTMQSRMQAISGEITFSQVSDDHFFATLIIQINALKNGHFN